MVDVDDDDIVVAVDSVSQFCTTLSSLSDSTDEFRSDRNLLSSNAVTVAVRDVDPEMSQK